AERGHAPAQRERGAGARAVGLLADDPEPREPRLARRAELGDREELRDDLALRVAGPAAEEHVALEPRRDERRHGVEVGREEHARLAPEREDVRAPGRRRMPLDPGAEAREDRLER